MANHYVSSKVFRQAFSIQWKEEISHGQDEVSRMFSNDAEWTIFMQRGNNGSDSFLCRVMNRLQVSNNSSPRLEYRTEYYTIDALFIGGECLLNKSTLLYPSEVHVLIEHENGPHVEEEMWKLIQWRVPLKVLIFYDFNDEERNASHAKHEWLATKLEYLKGMLNASHNFFSESIDTEYLFIIGARRYLGGPIYWRWASSKSWTTMELVS